jgi:predicted RNase H-like HicB family nuclease
MRNERVPRYEVDIFWSEEDGGYIANVPELPNLSAFAETYEEALREVRIAMDLYLSALREAGKEAHKPRGLPPPPCVAEGTPALRSAPPRCPKPSPDRSASVCRATSCGRVHQ